MTKIETLIARDPILAEAVAAEPVLRTLLIIASRWSWEGEQRWCRDYERCKRFAARFVGWDARNGALATTEHYERVIQAIVACLPAEQAVEDQAA